MARPRNSNTWGDELMRLISAMAVVIRAEADRLEDLGIDNDASDLGKITVDDQHATTALVLRSIANWIEEIISRQFT
jgi:hypothetical protein